MSEVLGLRFLFSPAPTLAFLEEGTVRIMLSTPHGAGTLGHNSILYFTGKDSVATHAAIVGRRAQEERAPQLAARMPDYELSVLWVSFVTFSRDEFMSLGPWLPVVHRLEPFGIFGHPFAECWSWRWRAPRSEVSSRISTECAPCEWPRFGSSCPLRSC